MDEYPIVPKPTEDIIEEEEFERLYTAPAEIIALLSIFYGSISILAIIGNTLVIWVVATTRQMRTVTNMYIANLAFADVIIGLFCIPFQFQAALLQRWNLPFFMCGFCPFVQALSVNVSVFTLTAIAIDRHRAVINPLRARPSRFVSKLIIVGIWIMAIIFATPCAIAFRVDLMNERIREGDNIYNITRPFCTNMNLSEEQLQLYRYTLVFVQYLVPFCVISFVYIQMAIKLWGTRAPGNAQDLRDLTLLRNKKKVIKMLIIVVIVFGLCWLPLQLYNILYVTIPEINEYHFISIVWFCCDWLAMSNSCYNPFIYGIYNEKFKREFNKRFAACFCKFNMNTDHPDRGTVSMHTRASSVRSTYANSSMRFRCSGGKLTANSNLHPYFRNDNSTTTTMTMLKNINSKASNNGNRAFNNKRNYGRSANHEMNSESTNERTILSNHCMNEPKNGNSMNGKFKYHWRNHFKLLQSVVVENEDNQSLLNLQLPISSMSEQEFSTAEDNIILDNQRAESNLKGANCICELELGSRTECDGSCILNEVSRVQVPITAIIAPPSPPSIPSPSPPPPPTTTKFHLSTSNSSFSSSTKNVDPCCEATLLATNEVNININMNMDMDIDKNIDKDVQTSSLKSVECNDYKLDQRKKKRQSF